MRLGGLFVVLAACGSAAKPTTSSRGAACDLSASWTGSAVDPSGVPWHVLLVLHHDGTAVAGTAEWTAEGGRFVEDVTGSVDCPAGVVTLRTTGSDAPATATYRLELSTDDRAITGSWDTGTGTLGTLTAARKTADQK